MNKGIDPVLNSARGSMEEIVQQTVKVSSEIEGLTKTAREFVQRLDRITADQEPNIVALFDSLKESSNSLDMVLKEVQVLVEQLKIAAAPDSAFQNDLQEVFDELEKAALSMRGLADFLRRHPEALLQGKGEK